MAPDEEAPFTLPKWPFYLGDALLVAAALAIAYLGEGRLDGWEVASCVLAVALGAGFFVLPHVLEFQARGEAERAAERGRRGPDAATERRLRRLEAALTSAETSLRELRGARLALEEGLETLSQGVDRRMENARTERTETASAVVDIEARLRALENGSATGDTPDTDAGGAPAAGSDTPHTKRPARKARRRKQPQGPLLDRAIRGRKETPKSAVSRIIGGRREAAEAEPPEAAGTDAGPPNAPAPDAEVPEPGASPRETAVPGAVPEESAEAEESGGEEAGDDGATGSGGEPASGEMEPVEAEARSDGPAEASGAGEAAVVEEPAGVEAVPEARAEGAAPSAEEPEDLFGGSVPREPKKRRKVKGGDTVVTANVLIGIGNKPYLRGEGGGLSWESGVPMEFDGVGRWRWVAPPDSAGPFTVRVYRNDEAAENGGPYTVAAGEKRELHPVF